MARFAVESLIALLLSLSIIGSNVLILLVVLKTRQCWFLNKYFFVSMTAADLALGIFVIPFSFWATVFGTWIYGDRFCHFEAYLAAILWMGGLFSLTWLAIDHYVTMKNPERQGPVISGLRSACWVAMVWVAAVSFCSPAAVGVAGADYLPYAYICVIDWHGQKAYVITSGLLVTLPSLVVLTVTGKYLVSDEYAEDRALCTDSKPRHRRYVSTMLVSVMYVIAWLPWGTVQVMTMVDEQLATHVPPVVHFIVVWLALANSLVKFFIYVITDSDFRNGLVELGSLLMTGCQAQRHHPISV